MEHEGRKHSGCISRTEYLQGIPLTERNWRRKHVLGQRRFIAETLCVYYTAEVYSA